MKEEHDAKKRTEHDSESPVRKIANTDELNDRIADKDFMEEASAAVEETGTDHKDIEIQIRKMKANQ